MKPAIVLLLSAACALLTAAGQISLKTGVSAPGLVSLLQSGSTLPFLVRAMTTPLVIVGLALYVASSALWLTILARADVSFAFPLVSMAFVLTAGYAHFVLHEQVSFVRAFGIGLIILGVIFVSRS